MADNITDIRYVRTAQRERIDHLEADLSTLLAELAEGHRQLKPGGTLLLKF